MRHRRLLIALCRLAGAAAHNAGLTILWALAAALSVLGLGFLFDQAPEDRAPLQLIAQMAGGTVLAAGAVSRSWSCISAAWRRAWWLWRVYPGKRRDLGRHEAGHALLGIVLDLPYRAITLESDENNDNGLALYLVGKMEIAYPPLDVAARMICALEAGKAAERGNRLNGTYLHNATLDQAKAQQLDSLRQFCGEPPLQSVAATAVRQLFRSPHWRAALDEIAALAAAEGVVDKAALHAAVEKHALRVGIDAWLGVLYSSAASPAKQPVEI
jgi:hypothetical protein